MANSTIGKSNILLCLAYISTTDVIQCGQDCKIFANVISGFGGTEIFDHDIIEDRLNR